MSGALGAALFVLAATALGSVRARAQVTGGEAVPSTITVIDIDGKAPRVVHKADRRVEAPNWAPEGSHLYLNSGGRLWRLPVKGGNPRPIPTPTISGVGINHGVAPGGKRLAVSAGPIFVLPSAGGEARQVTTDTAWFHSWAPDGRAIAYTANRGNGADIFVIDASGGPERRLTANPATDDAPDYTPDGRWIYFNSDRAGNSDIWRVPVEGASPADARAERVTSDDFQDWFPHPSPDGRWLIFLSYPKSVLGHPADEDVMIRRLRLPGAKLTNGKVEEVVRLVGGLGSIGSEPWSPDGKQFSYVRFEPPAPQMKIVFFTPSDVRPPALPDVRRRLTQAADAAERFLVAGMRQWNYPPANERLFGRQSDGSVEILFVKGDQPLASGRYQKPTFAGEVIERATRQYKIAGDKHLWWIFTFMGDPPRRIDEYRGGGDSWNGGWALVNYSTIAGQLLPEISLAQGFNEEWTLKGIVHELGHTFGLPHIGPDPNLGLGNSLMGPNNSEYAGRKLPKADRVYLTEASAAMLWKHPLFSGTHKDRARRPVVTLSDYAASQTRKEISLRGKVTSGLKAHSVVVLDDLGRPNDPYWWRGHAARVADDGTFRVAFQSPPTDGTYRLMFCFDNGAVSGDHKQPDYYGAIVKSYRFRKGRYEFSK